MSKAIKKLSIYFIILIGFFSQHSTVQKISAQECIEERDHSPGNQTINGTYLFYCEQLSCTHSPDAQGNDVYALRCDNSNAIYSTYRTGKITDQCAIFPKGEDGYHYLPTGQACECLAYQIDWMNEDSAGNLNNIGWTMDDPPQTNCQLSPTPTKTPTPSLTPSSIPSLTPTISPTPTITPTLSPTPRPHNSSCDDLTILSGNNSLVPANITFQASASDSDNNIQRYRFYFGDGQTEESTNSQISHRYESSGTFTARVEAKDSRGNWQTSNSCTTTVTVKSNSVESHKSDCSDVFITAGNGAFAPSQVKFTVTGYDNKGNLKAYKIDYGDSNQEEKTNNQFSHYYSTAGTYTIRAYIKDSRDNWKGGDNGCKKTLYIKTEPLTSQPSTGTPTFYSLGAIISGLTSFSSYLFKKKFLA